MKNDPLVALLVGLLLVCGVFISWLSVRHFFMYRDLQRLQGEVAKMNQTRNAAQLLAAEAVEYGKRNPAITPLLQQFQLLERPGAPAATRPATR
jgi:hypothetical protein